MMDAVYKATSNSSRRFVVTINTYQATRWLTHIAATTATILLVAEHTQ